MFSLEHCLVGLLSASKKKLNVIIYDTAHNMIKRKESGLNDEMILKNSRQFAAER
jgi:hypothetical protein